MLMMEVCFVLFDLLYLVRIVGSVNWLEQRRWLVVVEVAEVVNGDKLGFGLVG